MHTFVDELEVGQVVWVHVAVGVGLEGHAVPGGDKPHVARIEYLPRQHGPECWSTTRESGRLLRLTAKK